MVNGEIIKGIYRKHAQYESKNDQDYLDDAAVVSWIKHAFADATAGNAVGENVVIRVPFACRLLSAHVAGQTVAADNTDYATFSVYKKTGSAASVLIASGDTRAASLNGLTVNVPAALTLATTAGYLELAAGDVVTFGIAKANSGKATTAAVTAAGGQGNLTLKIERVYA